MDGCDCSHTIPIKTRQTLIQMMRQVDEETPTQLPHNRIITRRKWQMKSNYHHAKDI